MKDLLYDITFLQDTAPNRYRARQPYLACLGKQIHVLQRIWLILLI